VEDEKKGNLSRNARQKGETSRRNTNTSSGQVTGVSEDGDCCRPSECGLQLLQQMAGEAGGFLKGCS
jgi:hypothetical protein